MADLISSLSIAASVDCFNRNSPLVRKTRPAETGKNRKTLVLGIGNPILRDDRVGHFLIQALRSRISNPDITFQETSLAGLSLAESLAGFKSAVVIDAIQSGGVPGEVYCLGPEDFHPGNACQNNWHGVGLIQALELGRNLGWPMPQDVTIVAIEAGDISHFGDDLTPEVEKAMPLALQTVLELLNKKAI